MEYSTKAVNSHQNHENRIHSNEVAPRFGFKEGLVAGVNVYGALTVPAVRHFGTAWLEHGWMRVRFHQPFYEGEEICVRAALEDGMLRIDAGRAGGEAGLQDEAAPGALTEAPLPAVREEPTRELLRRDCALGSFRQNLAELQARAVEAVGDPDGLYGVYAHPAALLGLANEILVRNFVLRAWIHTGSEVRNYRAARVGDRVVVTGRIRDVYEKKGHEFLVAEVMLSGEDGSVAQTVRHVAIWKLRGDAAIGSTDGVGPDAYGARLRR